MNNSVTFKALDTPKWVLIFGGIFIAVWLVATIVIFNSVTWYFFPFALGLILWQANLIFATIVLTDTGVTYKSWFSDIFIAWGNIKTLGGIVRVKRQFFEIIEIDELKIDIAYKSQLDRAFYQGEVRKYVFISTNEKFSPNRFSWMNEKYIYFEYRPAILKIIQEKLEAINKNV
jgi:hypothetical protein